MKLKLLAAAALAIPMLLAGCVTSETKPIPKIAAKQATVHIPEAELLDVGIRVFDPGIPKNIENDDAVDAGRKQRGVDHNDNATHGVTHQRAALPAKRTENVPYFA